MKRNELQNLGIFICIFCTFSFAYAQNTYDPYKSLVGHYLVISMPPYDGEYENLVTDFYPNTSNPAYVPSIFDSPGYIDSIKVVIENVSFPFYPACGPLNLEVYGDCNNANSIIRKLNVFSDADRDEIGWQDPYGTTTRSIFEKVMVKAQTQTCGTNPLETPSMTLISYIFKLGDLTSGSNCRIVLPHGVLKHTYIFYGVDENAEYTIDTISYIFDHTRGRMKHYPFQMNNSSAGGGTEAHDIIFTNLLGDVPNTSGPKEIISILMLSEKTSLAGYAATTGYHSYFPASPENNDYEYTTSSITPDFTVPEHEYIIDKSLDLKKINSKEQVIYMPSVAVQTADQVFPSGYTFKTVYGLAPTNAQLSAQNPNNLYGSYTKIPVRSALTIDDNPDTWYDEAHSVYIVKEGSKLTIEPCVALYDLDIYFQDNTEFVYHEDYIEMENVNLYFSQSTTVDSEHDFDFGAFPCFFECYNYDIYDFSNHTISSNTTWAPGNYTGTGSAQSNDVLRISHELLITAGNKLTLNAGTRLEFGVNGRIVIEPGAELYCYGNSGDYVVLTSACNQLWGGILNKGSFISPQSYVYQGNVNMLYTMVENARIGVQLGKIPNAGGDEPLWKFNGGVITTYYCTFRNNEIDVEFLPYTNSTPSSPIIPISNSSNFLFTTFETTNTLDGFLYPKHHVRLIGVQGVRFRNCTFQNDIPNEYVPHERGIGIFSFMSNYTLGIDGGSNNVRNLTEGILHLGSYTDLIRVGNTNFENNIRSITLIGSSSSIIADCYFEVPESEYPTLTSFPPEHYVQSYNYANPVGIHLLGSYGYSIKNNRFNTNYTSAEGGNNKNYGAVVNSTVQDVDETGIFYMNQFGTLDIGLQAEGNNGLSTLTGPAGLSIKCNQFENTSSTSYDITLTGKFSSSGIVLGTLRDQGSCVDITNQFNSTYPAGNEFFRACTPVTDHNHVLNSYMGNYFLYTTHDVTEPYITPDCSNLLSIGNSLIVNCGFPFERSEACPEPGGTVSTPAHLLQLKSKADSVMNHYFELLDGGNTAWLLGQVDLLYADPEELTELLLEHSPYLSDTVLKRAFDLEIQFDNEHLYEIVLANSPLTADAFALLEYYRPQFTAYMFEAMEGWQSGVSGRKQLELLIKELDFEYKTELNFARAYYREEMALDSLHDLREDHELEINEIEAFEELIFWKDSSAVDSALAQIDSSTFQFLLAHWWITEQTPQTLNGYEQNVLMERVNANPLLAWAEKELLAQSGSYVYDRRPWPVEPEEEKNKNINKPPKAYTELLVVYPNPTGAKLTIEIRAKDIEGILIIKDLLGRPVIQKFVAKDERVHFINLEYLVSGLYIVHFVGANGNSDAIKVIKQ